MRVYKATYILNSDMKGNLVDWFDFEQERDDKWEQRDYGYFYPDGYFGHRAEENISVNNYLCYAANEKFFDRQLTEEELRELELQMRKECVVALDKKRKYLVDSITKQIEFIVR